MGVFVVAVAGADQGGGNSSIVLGLAAALLERGKRVLVVDLAPDGFASTWLWGREGEYPPPQPPTVAEVLAGEAVPPEAIRNSPLGIQIAVSSARLTNLDTRLDFRSEGKLALHRALRAMDETFWLESEAEAKPTVRINERAALRYPVAFAPEHTLVARTALRVFTEDPEYWRAVRQRVAAYNSSRGFDYVLIDCQLGPAGLLAAGVRACDEMIVTVPPAELARRRTDPSGVAIAATALERVHVAAGVPTPAVHLIASRVPKQDLVQTAVSLKAFAERHNLGVLQTVVRESEEVPECMAGKRLITAYDNRTAVSKDFRELAAELLTHWEGGLGTYRGPRGRRAKFRHRGRPRELVLREQFDEAGWRDGSRTISWSDLGSYRFPRLEE